MQSATQDTLTHDTVSSNVFRGILICSCLWKNVEVHSCIYSAITSYIICQIKS